MVLRRRQGARPADVRPHSAPAARSCRRCAPQRQTPPLHGLLTPDPRPLGRSVTALCTIADSLVEFAGTGCRRGGGGTEDVLPVAFGLQPMTPITSLRVDRLALGGARQARPDLLLGVLADRAGVVEDHVGGVAVLDPVRTHRSAELAEDRLAVEHVHLAAEGFEENFRHRVGSCGGSRSETPHSDRDRRAIQSPAAGNGGRATPAFDRPPGRSSQLGRLLATNPVQPRQAAVPPTRRSSQGCETPALPPSPPDSRDTPPQPCSNNDDQDPSAT